MRQSAASVFFLSSMLALSLISVPGNTARAPKTCWKGPVLEMPSRYVASSFSASDSQTRTEMSPAGAVSGLQPFYVPEVFRIDRFFSLTGDSLFLTEPFMSGQDFVPPDPPPRAL